MSRSSIHKGSFFCETLHVKFHEKKTSHEMTKLLSFTDVGKSCPSRKFFTWKICLLTLFMKIKFSQNFPN